MSAVSIPRNRELFPAPKTRAIRFGRLTGSLSRLWPGSDLKRVDISGRAARTLATTFAPWQGSWGAPEFCTCR